MLQILVGMSKFHLGFYLECQRFTLAFLLCGKVSPWILSGMPKFHFGIPSYEGVDNSKMSLHQNRITTVEKFRRAVSWIIALVFLFLVIFSRTPFEGTAFYEGIEIIGFILVSLATLGRIWCSVYIAGYKDKVLCQDGPYSIVRNPLYVFSFLGLTGIMFVSQSLLLALTISSAYLIYYTFIIKSEEKRLLETFGKEFSEYCSKVNRILPNFRKYWTRKSIEVNPVVLLRAISDAGCFIWILILMEVIEYMKRIQINGESLLPVLWHLPF